MRSQPRAAAGGHATLFRPAATGRDGVFHAACATRSQRIHARLKAEFDPRGIFNPGRLYAEL